MSDFTIEIDDNGTYFLSGRINEYSDLKILGESKNNPLLINLKGVTLINSVGVSMWMDFLRGILGKERAIEYFECSDIFISQCNMVPSLTKEITVHSCYGSFICEECDRDHMRLLQIKDVDINDLPTFPCPSCGSKMEIENDDQLDFLDW